MRVALVLVLFAAVAMWRAAAQFDDESACSGTFSGGVTCPPPTSNIGPIKFSRLKNLVNSVGYSANSSDTADFTWTYIYNLGSIVSRPDGCPAGREAAVAYQLDERDTGPSNQGCYRLSGPMNSTNTKIELLNPSKPASGIRLVVGGGDDAYCGRPREVRFDLSCATTGEAQHRTPVFETVEETLACVYTIKLETSYACPDTCAEDGADNVCGSHGDCVSNNDVEGRLASAARCECDEAEGWYGPSCSSRCPGWNAELQHRSQECSSRGHCDYDTTKQAASCFCETGYTGETCGDSIAASTAGAGAAWALCAVAFVGVLIGWFYHRRTIDEPFCPCGECGGDHGTSAPAFSSSSDYMPPSL